MNTKNSLVCFVTILCAIPLAAAFADEIQVITEFTYPAENVITIPEGINDAGDIVGRITGLDGFPVRGFLRFANSRFAAPIIDPNEFGTGYTDVRGINDSNHLCGFHLSTSEGLIGFVASRAGFKEYDLSHAFWQELYGINDADDVCGAVSEDRSAAHFFPIIVTGGTHVKITIPGATTGFAYGINNLGEVAGAYLDSLSEEHGFFRDAAGTVTAPIDPPGSTLTILFGLNDEGLIVGRFVDSSGVERGFVLQLPDTYVIFDQPDATLTSLNGINNSGVMCGRVVDSSGAVHGVVAEIVEGP